MAGREEGSVLECGDELLDEVRCDGVRGKAGTQNENGGGSVLECGDELLAEVDCDASEQFDEFDLCLFLILSGRTRPVSDMFFNFSSRFSSAT